MVLPILNFESHFCELSLHQLEKRELVFSFDLETVIPIVQKQGEKLKFRFGESMLLTACIQIIQ